jgi:protein-disulfide isomerase
MLIVYRHFPLSEIHPYAFPAAIAAEAAARQRHFWAMHDMIFENQSVLSEYALIEFATTLRLNMTTFKADLQDPALAEKVESHFESGVRSGVNGTPSFFINGFKYNGGYDFDSLSRAIQMSMHHTH